LTLAAHVIMAARLFDTDNYG